jgi:hypothetical protein
MGLRKGSNGRFRRPMKRLGKNASVRAARRSRLRVDVELDCDGEGIY